MSLVARLEVTRSYVTSPSSSIPPSTLTGAGCLFLKLLLLHWLNFISFLRWSLIFSSYSSTSLFTVMIGAIGSMSFLTPLLVIQEESHILWKLILLFPDLRVMVPVSNLIMALAVIRNGVPKMKGLFSFSLISRITKSTGNTCLSSVYFEFPPIVILLCYIFLRMNLKKSPGPLNLLLGDLMLQNTRQAVEHGCSTAFIFLVLSGVYVLGFAGREFLEKPKHFSHPTVDFLALLEDGVLKSFHSFSVRSHPSWSRGQVLIDFPGFRRLYYSGVLHRGAVNIGLKMKGEHDIKFGFEANDRCHDEGNFRFCGFLPVKEYDARIGCKISPQCSDGNLRKVRSDKC
ncbi:hypothetical protein Tco_1561459 [Tanacetum coccineum]